MYIMVLSSPFCSSPFSGNPCSFDLTVKWGFPRNNSLRAYRFTFFVFVFLVPKFSFLMLYFTFSSSGYSLFCFYIHFSCAIATIKSLLCT